MNREHIKGALLNVLTNMKDVEDYNEILTYIFDYYLSASSSDKTFSRMHGHLSSVFNFHPHALYDVLISDENIRLEELELPQGNYKNAYRLIRKLKSKYGQIIRDLTVRERDPFSIHGADVNVNPNESTHKLKLIRGDGEYLNMNFKPESLMPVLMVLTQALDQSIRQGIFNLDEGLVHHYMNANDNINTQLKEILSRKANE